MKRYFSLAFSMLLLMASLGCEIKADNIVNDGGDSDPIHIVGTAESATPDTTATNYIGGVTIDTPVATATPTPEPTPTPSPTPTPTPTITPTLTPTPTVGVTPTPNSTKAEQFIAIAKGQLDAPYVRGGVSVETDGGYDPGGFIYFCLKQMGESCRHKTSKGYSEMEEWTYISDMDQLLAGDLIFFRVSDSTDVNCACIYLGDGLMIYPSSSEGKVITTKLRTDYWIHAFAFGRRVYG